MNTPTHAQAPETTGGEAATPKFYPYPDEELGVFFSEGNTHPFDGSEADWAAFKKACARRDHLERENATLHAQIARMKQREGELRAALEENTGRLAFMTGAFRPHLRPEDVKANTDAFLSARAALQSVAKEGEQ